MGYRKSDVQTHNAGGYNGPRYPAVNVKCYDWPDIDASIERFKCSRETAERAAQWAWESAQEQFWEIETEYATEHFGRGVDAYSAGRSGGWLVVMGLPDIEYWDALDLAKWRGFESGVKRSVKAWAELEPILDTIDANRWAEENSERYNFTDKDGATVCLADVERCAHCG